MYEVNFDCLTGPTYYFGGLSLGNLASEKNKQRVSNPKKTALQGLMKMKILYEHGFKQAVLPPHPRPNWFFLKNLGFSGSTEQGILQKVYEEDQRAFFSSLSSSFMWAANMATFSPKVDCIDGKSHFTPANLATMLHRSTEPWISYNILKQIFFNENHFVVHEPIACHDFYSDEGAANHNRITGKKSVAGLEIFVHSKDKNNFFKTQKFPPRQSLLSQKSISRNHQLKHGLFIEQNPLAIDNGAFHNDVVCVMNDDVILLHEKAFLEQKKTLSNLREKFKDSYEKYPTIIEINNSILPISDAVLSYLFNSQLLSKEDGSMLLFTPREAFFNQKSKKAIDYILTGDNPINEIKFFDIKESMDNGGGPACLRLRVLLEKEEIDAIRKDIWFNEKLFDNLSQIINSFYEEEFYPEKALSQYFLDKTKDCYSAIYKILALENPFKSIGNQISLDLL